MRAKKVLLVAPPNRNISKDYLPPLGILYIAAVLKKNKFNVEILDCPIEGYNCEDATSHINKGKYDVVGITGVSDTRYFVFDIIKNIKKGPKIVVGGVHFSFVDYHTIKEYKNVYAVVRNEGEYPFLEICKGTPLEKIDGITFRNKKGRVVRNKNSEFIDVKDIPWPARELVPMKKYRAKLEGEYKTRSTSIITSRGCPNNCVFCANKAYWRQRLRLREPKDVVDEIEHIVKEYGIRGIDIWDDTFTISKKHVRAICEEILRRKLKIKFYARVRVNTVDEELLKLMKKAGCVAMSWGVETGSTKVLKAIRKNITYSQVFKVSKISKKLRLHSKVFFMFNHPEETYSDLLKTFRLMHLMITKYNVNCAIGMTTVYPGTDLEIDMRKRNIIKSGFNWNNYYNRLNKLIRFDPIKLYYKNLNKVFIMLLYILYFKLVFRLPFRKQWSPD